MRVEKVFISHQKTETSPNSGGIIQAVLLDPFDPSDGWLSRLPPSARPWFSPPCRWFPPSFGGYFSAVSAALVRTPAVRSSGCTDSQTPA